MTKVTDPDALDSRNQKVFDYPHCLIGVTKHRGHECTVQLHYDTDNSGDSVKAVVARTQITGRVVGNMRIYRSSSTHWAGKQPMPNPMFLFVQRLMDHGWDVLLTKTSPELFVLTWKL